MICYRFDLSLNLSSHNFWLIYNCLGSLVNIFIGSLSCYDGILPCRSQMIVSPWCWNLAFLLWLWQLWFRAQNTIVYSLVFHLLLEKGGLHRELRALAWPQDIGSRSWLWLSFRCSLDYICWGKVAVSLLTTSPCLFLSCCHRGLFYWFADLENGLGARFIVP